MPSLRPSPLDSIAPAFARTSALLFKPFHWSRSWKLAAISYLALMGSFFLPFPLLLPVAVSMAPRALLDALPPGMISLMSGIALLYLAIYLGLFYVGTRLEMMQFEMIVTMSNRPGLMWKRQGARLWPWLGVKVAVGSLMTALLAPIIVLLGIRLVAAIPRLSSQISSPQNFNAVLTAIYGVYALLLAVFAVFLLIATLLNDFVLPLHELEGISITTALARAWTMIVAEPLQIGVYLLVKAVLALLGWVAASVLGQICAIAVVLLVALGAAGLHLTIRGAGYNALAGIVIIIGLLFLVLMLYVQIGVYGYVMMVLDAFALHFAGTRYAPLGELMNPSTGAPPPFTPPPPMPSPDEDDDDDGPPLPMDPALA